MAHPIVYGPALSSYVWSTRLALAEKGVTHVLVEVPLGANREAPHLARQPFGKVPAFEHDGFTLYETQAILRYIEEAFSGPPLQPEDIKLFARMNQIIGIIDAYGWPSIVGAILVNRVLLPRFFGRAGDEAAIAAAVPRARLVLSEIERLMGENPFLVHEHLSLADLLACPLLWLFARSPEGEAAFAEHPRLSRWLTRMEARQSFAVTRPDLPGAPS
jgi:glutathione S-transferase